MPQNAEEAAYASFALLEALIKFLVSKGVATPDEIDDAVFRAAITTLRKVPNNACDRAADFIRDMMLNRPRHPA
jgi:hypothetical protein